MDKDNKKWLFEQFRHLHIHFLLSIPLTLVIGWCGTIVAAFIIELDQWAWGRPPPVPKPVRILDAIIDWISWSIFPLISLLFFPFSLC